MSGDAEELKEARAVRLLKIEYSVLQAGLFLEKYFWPIWVVAFVVLLIFQIWWVGAICLALMIGAYVGPDFADWLSDRIRAYVKYLDNKHEATL